MITDEQRAELAAAITEGIPELSAADGRLLADALAPVVDRIVKTRNDDHEQQLRHLTAERDELDRQLAAALDPK